MGYRSDVYCQIDLPNKTSEELIKELKDRYEQKGLTKDFDYLFDKIYIKKDCNHCNVIFMAYDVKWYDGYPEVNLFMDFIREIGDPIDEENKNCETSKETFEQGYVYYLRIGEYMDDTEEQIWGFADQDLEFTRNVMFKTELFEDIKLK